MSLHGSRLARPIDSAGGRSIGWWGAVLGLIAIAHLYGAALVAAIYLRAASATWPPAAHAPPKLWLGATAALAAVLAAVGVTVAARRLRSGRGAVASLLVAALLAAAAGVTRATQTVAGEGPTAHAFWSIRALVAGLDAVLLATVAVMAAMLAWHTARATVNAEQHAEIGIAGLWSSVTAVFVIAGWVVLAALVSGGW